MAANNSYSPYGQPPPPGGGTYATRSAQAYGDAANQPTGQPYGQQQQQSQQQQQQYQHLNSPPPNQSFQQPQYYSPAPPVSQQSQPTNTTNLIPQYGQGPSSLPSPSPSSLPYQAPNSSLQHIQAQSQQNLLEASIRRMQEATHIMRGAMDADDLPTTLDRAAAMLSELGDAKHHHHSHSHHDHRHGHGKGGTSTSTAIMSPKHYYEIHMLAMEELPNIEEYLVSLSSGSSPRYTMKDLYEITQYTSRAVSRLYLQICAGSALIRSGEEDAPVVLNDLIQAVKCVQCPIRGLFLRDYLLKAVRDKLPDEVEQDDTPVPAPLPVQQDQSNDANPHGFEDVIITEGQQQQQQSQALNNLMGDLTVNMNSSDGFLADNITPNNQEEKIQEDNSHIIARANSHSSQALTSRVKDSYQFVLANFIEMNKLWVRIQHLPSDSKDKGTKRRRERERNELRMMVGTNLVRLSELEGVTSAIYGTVILPRILDQITACRDPLAQAYLMDCIIQVFPDEFHIQTLEVVLSVCPKLREKVNIRTILQSIMDRLSNYYADELLLNDEEDTEGVKTSVMLDSFEMFDECIQSVLQGRGSKINAKEVIRLESSLLDFSLKCYPGRMDHINRCLGACASCLRGEGASQGVIAGQSGAITPIPMDEMAVKELEKLLSLPLQTMGLNILDLDQYSELLAFLPIDHRKRVGLELLSVLYSSGEKMSSLPEIEHLFTIISPLIRTETNTGQTSANLSPQALVEKESISKLIHLLYNEDTDAHFEILNFVKKYLFSASGGLHISSHTMSPLFFSSMKLLARVQDLEFPKLEDAVEDEHGDEKDVKEDIEVDEGQPENVDDEVQSHNEEEVESDEQPDNENNEVQCANEGEAIINEKPDDEDDTIQCANGEEEVVNDEKLDNVGEVTSDNGEEEVVIDEKRDSVDEITSGNGEEGVVSDEKLDTVDEVTSSNGEEVFLSDEKLDNVHKFTSSNEEEGVITDEKSGIVDEEEEVVNGEKSDNEHEEVKLGENLEDAEEADLGVKESNTADGAPVNDQAEDGHEEVDRESSNGQVDNVESEHREKNAAVDDKETESGNVAEDATTDLSDSSIVVQSEIAENKLDDAERTSDVGNIVSKASTQSVGVEEDAILEELKISQSDPSPPKSPVASDGDRVTNKFVNEPIKSSANEKAVQSLFFESLDAPAISSVFCKVTNCRKIFLFVQKLLSFLEMTNPDLCFNLRLQAAAAANRCALASVLYDRQGDLAPIAYEFMTEAFLTYEAEITDSTAQKNAMIKMIGILLSCECFEKTDYEALITKTTQYAARLLKKTDQCSMVLMCSHLFFKHEKVYQNPQRVLECLQRALKLADICTTASPVNLQLFIDIFAKYVYFFENANPYITDRFISGLIALINEHINCIGVNNSVIRGTKEEFIHIVQYIERKKVDSVDGPKFEPIVCSFPY